MLIALEALDGAGKTTQSEGIKSFFEQCYESCEIINFPNYESDSGKLIRAYLDGAKQYSQIEVNLLYSLNRYAELKLLKTMIDKFDHVVLNRYYYSNMAYGAFDGCDRRWIKRTDDYMPNPDIIFYLDIPAYMSLERTKGKQFDVNESNLEYLQDVRTNYKQLAKIYNMITVDATGPPEQVTDTILAHLVKQLR